MAKRPHFICIGAQRGGTSNLYRMLRLHPDIWLPPIKELHFFDLPLDRPRRRRELAELEGRTKRRDKRFLKRLTQAIEDGDQSVKRYRSLFGPSEEKVTGDITPGYGTLPSETVAKLARRLPNTAVLFIIREPMSRLWSHARMVQSKKKGTPLADADSFKAFCEDPAVRLRSLQSDVFERWSASFGTRFHVLFFDDLVADSQAFYARVHEIIGVEHHPVDTEREHAPAPKPKMPEEMRRHAEVLLEGEYERLAELVGGHAETWLQKRRAAAA
ncbi:sulfotransferase [Microbaculum marinum]|uniref:Sulfotransferase n=1 Tax=Microbaculum marinum TaxID=1764581 RepID=A0AAW9RC25_9HYPH